MSTAANRALLRRFIEVIDAEGDTDALADYVQEDIVLPADTVPNGRQGIDGLREHFEFLHGKLDYRATVETMVAEEDDVAARIRIEGRLLEEFMGLPVNGKSFAVDEFMFARFRDGKIAQIWRLVNLAAVVEQLR